MGSTGLGPGARHEPGEAPTSSRRGPSPPAPAARAWREWTSANLFPVFSWSTRSAASAAYHPRPAPTRPGRRASRSRGRAGPGVAGGEGAVRPARGGPGAISAPARGKTAGCRRAAPARPLPAPPPRAPAPNRAPGGSWGPSRLLPRPWLRGGWASGAGSTLPRRPPRPPRALPGPPPRPRPPRGQPEDPQSPREGCDLSPGHAMRPTPQVPRGARGGQAPASRSRPGRGPRSPTPVCAPRDPTGSDVGRGPRLGREDRLWGAEPVSGPPVKEAEAHPTSPYSATAEVSVQGTLVFESNVKPFVDPPDSTCHSLHPASVVDGSERGRGAGGREGRRGVGPAENDSRPKM